MPRSQKSWHEIQRVLDAPAHKDLTSETLETAQVEEMMVMSCLACPKEKTLRNRQEYFPDIQFRGLEELLRLAKEADFV